MATTGVRWATTATGASWVSPGNARNAADGVYAEANTSGALVLGGYGFSLPAGASNITGVVDAYVVNVGSLSMRLLAGSTVLAGWSDTDQLTFSCTREQASTLSVEISLRSGSRKVQIDACSIEITYDDAVLRDATGPIAVGLAVSGVQVILDGLQRDAASPIAVGLAASISQAYSLGAAAGIAVGLAADAHKLLPSTVVLARTPRSLDALLAGSAPRLDHVQIVTGPHAGRRLPTISCSLTLDATRDVRCTGSLTAAPDAWVRDLLDPRERTELAIMMGVRGDDGTEHLWQVALLHVTERPQSIDAGGRRELSAQLADRSDWVRAAGMRQRLVIPGSQTIQSGIAKLLAERAGWLPQELGSDPGFTFGEDAVLGELGADAWKVACELARGLGLSLYVDALGVARTASLVDPLTAPAAVEWVEGVGVQIDVGASISLDGCANVIGVAWQESAPNPQPEGWQPDGGVEWWEDHTSSVSIERIGERVRAYGGDTSVITSPAQAREVAMAAGLAQQGIAVPVTLTGRWDPRRQIGDVVHVRRPELGVDLTTSITGLDLEIGSPTMRATLAERRIL